MIFNTDIERNISGKILSSLRYYCLSVVHAQYEENCIQLNADASVMCDVKKPVCDLSMLADGLIYNGPLRIEPDAVMYLPQTIGFRNELVFASKLGDIENHTFISNGPCMCAVSHPYNIRDCKFICSTPEPDQRSIFRIGSTYACTNVQIKGFTILYITFDIHQQNLPKILEDGFIAGVHFNDDVKCVCTPSHIAVKREYSAFMNRNQRSCPIFIKHSSVNKEIPGWCIFSRAHR